MFNKEPKVMICIKRATMLLAILTPLFIAPSVSAQTDEEMIRSNLQEALDAYNTGNVDILEKLIKESDPNSSWFLPDRPFLVHKGDNSLEPLRAFFKAGGNIRINVHQPEIRVFGNAAVLATYLDGTITNPGSTTATPFALRGSYFYVKEKGKWTMVHYHESGVPTPK